jgi:methylglutaconyl-CoA hydratase
MAQDVVLVSFANRIATVTLNRPGKRNALDNVFIRELITAFEQCLEDKSIGVIIINGNGEHFCSGADIHWMHEVAQNSMEENKKDAMLLAKLLQMIYHSPKPVIVLAHGVSMGGGLGLISAADVAIAADNAVFAFTEVKIGITPSVISPYVVKAIGERAARYYFLTAERFHAQDAYRLGLVHQCVEVENVNAAGLSMAQQLLNNCSKAMSVAKELIHKVATENITPELADFTAEHLAKMRTTPEGREGLLSFSEKRPPRWK